MKKTVLIMVFTLMVATFINAQSRVEVKSSDLPKAITENITKDFSGFTIQNAFKINSNNLTSYEVTVQKGANRERLEYDSSGMFVKKEPIEHASVLKPMHKSTASKKK
jgi:hypothetical protein